MNGFEGHVSRRIETAWPARRADPLADRVHFLPIFLGRLADYRRRLKPIFEIFFEPREHPIENTGQLRRELGLAEAFDLLGLVYCHAVRHIMDSAPDPEVGYPYLRLMVCPQDCLVRRPEIDGFSYRSRPLSMSSPAEVVALVGLIDKNSALSLERDYLGRRASPFHRGN